MIDQETKNYIDSAMKSAQNAALYTTSNKSYHTHNGLDSPILPFQTMFGNGSPNASNLKAPRGTLYVNLTPTASNDRLYISQNSGGGWSSFQASA